MKKLFPLTTCFVVCYFTLLVSKAQTIDSSPYSIYGIGLINSSGSAINNSMSGTGIGLNSTQFLNVLNPASYPSPEFGTQITEFGIHSQKHLLTSGSRESSSSSANFSFINFWFRFSKKLAGTAGVAPFSQVGYNITFNNRKLNDEIVTANYSGAGGTTKYFVGSGYKITNNFSVGANLFLLHGSLSASELVESGQHTGLVISTQTYLTGTGVDGGIQYLINPNAKTKVTLGAVYRPTLQLNAKKKLAIVNSASLDSLYSELYNSNNKTVASKTGFGISLHNTQHLFATDVSYSKYPTAYTSNKVRMRNTYRLSAGYEYSGSQKPESYWSFVRPRLSFYAEQNEALLLNQKFINWGTTLGLGLPVSNGRGFVNLSYSYNHLGTTSRELIVQQTHSLSLDLSLMDIWGVRRKFD